MGSKILVLTCEMMPLSGEPVGGGGWRAWTLGEGLRVRGHEVVYSVPSVLLGRYGAKAAFLAATAYEIDALDEVVERIGPDVLLFEQWGLVFYLRDLKTPVIIDANGPLVLENTFRGHSKLVNDAIAKLDAFRRADLILCPGERQKYYLATWCMLCGMDPRDLRIEIVPPSMPPDVPSRVAAEERVFVYSGTLWPWLDSHRHLEVVASELDGLGTGKLKIFARLPPSENVVDGTQVAWQEDTRLRLLSDAHSSVELHGASSRDVLIDTYLRASVAVDLYVPNLERELAIPTRTFDYLWCGLPIIHGRYGELADVIDKWQAGWIVDPEDEEGLRRVIQDVVLNPQECVSRGANAQDLIRRRFSWDGTLDALDAYCREPRKRRKGAILLRRVDAGKGVEECLTGKDAAALRVEELEDHVQAAEDSIRSLKDEVSKRDACMAVQERRLAELAVSLSETSLQGMELRRAMEDKDRRLGHLQLLAFESENRIRLLTEDVAAREAKIGELEACNAETREMVNEAEVEIANIQEQLARAERDRELLDGIVRSFKSHLPYRLYVGTKRQVSRYVVQWPALFYMFILSWRTARYSRRQNARIAEKQQIAGGPRPGG